MPSMTTWNRLTSGSRLPTIDPGLEARVHDPLWLLARQYQLGEFNGEDAGAPIAVRLRHEVTPLSRYHLGGVPSEAAARVDGRPIDPRGRPLEALVEGEAVRLGGTPNARVAIDGGLALRRRLRSRGLERDARALIAAFPFTAPDDDAALDASAADELALMSGRVADARAVHAHFASQSGRPLADWDWPDGLPDEPRDARTLHHALLDWLAWYARHVDEPANAAESSDPSGDAWDPNRQCYRFALAAHDGTEESAFVANGYPGGRLDWDALDGAPHLSLGATADDSGPRASGAHVGAMAAPLGYPGMPASRWWQMEDASVDFGGVRAAPTDLLRMLFVDFAVSYAGDWFLVPLELPYGTLTRVTEFEVTDVFGMRTTIPAVADAPDGAPWRMYTASGRAAGLVLPDVAATGFESAPLEEVALVRDETANLAWGIEKRVAGPDGRPFDRDGAERARHAANAPSPRRPTADGAPRYRLASTVAANWIPLLPAREASGAGGTGEGALVLRRGAMLADPDAGGQRPTRALGRFLGANDEAFELFDEELPRAGLRLTRAWQYARGADGRAHLWLGRRRRTARRGEGRSGLAFDAMDGADPSAAAASVGALPPTT